MTSKWLKGGCLTYAVALMDVLEEGDLVAIIGPDGRPHHALVQRGPDLFSDALGDHTREEVQVAWADALGGPVTIVEASEDALPFDLDLEGERYEEAVEDVESTAWEAP